MLAPAAAVIILLLQSVSGQRVYRTNPCEQSSCYPATGDLLIGRERKLYASSTCGLQGPERYCIVSHLEDRRNKCFTCDTRAGIMDPRFNHSIDKIVSSFGHDRNERWWQARNGEKEVYIQLDLEAEFHFTHLIIRFKTFRPAAMLVERSSDFGRTWKVYSYFAWDCARSFPNVRTGYITSINDVICHSKYSSVEPSTEGEVVFRVLPPFIHIEDPYSEEVQDQLKITNLRVNFTELHTLGDNLLDSRPEIKEKYYYSMYDMVIRGSCSCYGHAHRCLPLPGQENNPNMLGMEPFVVHGRCECTHNTQGLNCEECEDFYNDLPWRPAIAQQTSACKECQCHNHARRCHFDPAVYGLTNGTSGGVCDDCQHNTMGRQCQECKPFFYRVPGRDLRDPNVCRACDCDPTGSEHNGECEGHTDPSVGLVAGRCICKRFVEGRRCDRCVANYWNMSLDNSDGCEACDCDQLGTIGNSGCDQQTGGCRCKRYVTGRQCDTCFAEYFGLSERQEGCSACDCDVGGAYDNDCDLQTGQCKCKPNMVGRRCDQPAPGFFVVGIDYLKYEGEYARGSGNTRAVIREPTPGRMVTWTGPGFMRVSEGDSLEFTIDDIQTSMNYDVVIRFEPQMVDRWDDVQVTLVRPGPVDEDGPCVNSLPQEDLKVTNLPKGSRYVLVSPSSCLERGVTYTLRFDFNRYRSGTSTPDASVLIDSILLTPNMDSIPIFKGQGLPERWKTEYEYYRCHQQQMSVFRSQIPEICRKHIFSISASIYNTAVECDCDQTGSVSGVCGPMAGQCECKSNVIGRRCDQCAPGFFGFGPDGCEACNCHAIGARDNFCDDNTGQCLCIPNAYGRDCGSCRRGFFGFPRCQQCQCNGRTEDCESDTGRCIDCRNNTAGDHCDECAYGYYGDAAPGSQIGCRECMCPGGKDSGFQHGNTCRLHPRTNEVQCACQSGYAGNTCSRCAENFYGNPLIPGGSCEPCTCNNNIDPDVPASCDSTTGECLKCLYNSRGFSCERCAPGFFGDATLQSCIECVCHILGTDRDAGPCHEVTGQCPCLPNVEGLRCDRCAADHWKIASGTGCEACSCDPQGSLDTQCNQYTGQCECIPGRGGRDCSSCPELYWGQPSVRCTACDCDEAGSASLQCDRVTGQCLCIEGVTDMRCDRCARGTTGELPFCVPCGECYNNWDLVIRQLSYSADLLVHQGGDIKIGGAPGAFEGEFLAMEARLDEVAAILEGTNVTEDDLNGLKQQLDALRENLTLSSDALDAVKADVDNTSSEVETAIISIDTIKTSIDNLKMAADQLRNNATNVRELDVSGAFNSTQESERRSQVAQNEVDGAMQVAGESEDVRQQVEELLEAQRAQYEEQHDDNNLQLTYINSTLQDLDEQITDINDVVCDGRGAPCDAVCGGAGCGQCGGGLSCHDGAVNKAKSALEKAHLANATVVTVNNQVDEILAQVDSIKQLCDMAQVDVAVANQKAVAAKNQSDNARTELQLLIETMTEFLEQQGARPSDIRQVAEVLNMSISLTPAQIQDLAAQINQTIRGLTDIDAILDETRDDLNNAGSLKQRADTARRDADEVLNTAQRVVDALEQARTAQDVATTSIDQAEADILDAEGHLAIIETDTVLGSEMANSSLVRVTGLKERVDELKLDFTDNEFNVEKAAGEAEEAQTLATEAQQKAAELAEGYASVGAEVELKYNETLGVKERADSLKERATQLHTATLDKMTNLRTMEDTFNINEKTLDDLSTQIVYLQEQMMLYVRDIQNAARCHRECEGNKPCPS